MRAREDVGKVFSREAQARSCAEPKRRIFVKNRRDRFFRQVCERVEIDADFAGIRSRFAQFECACERFPSSVDGARHPVSGGRGIGKFERYRFRLVVGRTAELGDGQFSLAEKPRRRHAPFENDAGRREAAAFDEREKF